MELAFWENIWSLAAHFSQRVSLFSPSQNIEIECQCLLEVTGKQKALSEALELHPYVPKKQYIESFRFQTEMRKCVT